MSGYGRAVLAALLLLLTGAGESAPDLRELAKKLESRDLRDRERAVRKLADVPGKPGLYLLLTGLADEAPAVRRAAREVLDRRRTAEDLELIADRGLRHRNAHVRLACLELLVRARPEGIGELLESLLTDRDPEVREAAVEHTFHVMGERGSSLLAAAVLRGREGRPRAKALLRLEELGDPGASPLAEKLLSDSSPTCRVAAVEVVARFPGDRGLTLVTKALSDRSWSVRLTAIRALAARHERASIPALIRHLGDEEGRLVGETGTALASLTGIGFPADAARWAAWWEKEKDAFEMPDKPARTKARDGDSAVTFHSIPVDSLGIAFVLDRSQSMRDRLDRLEEKRKGELVEEELEKTLGRLTPPARFLLIAFGTTPSLFQPGPVVASGGARQSAVKWFRRNGPEGRTNLFDSVALALTHEEIDTIFLLTDGAPSEGEHVTRASILEAVADRNRFRKAVVHTIEIGADSTGRRWRGFLRDLALSTGGRHVRR
jgi:HEAT repeat protein